MKVKTSYVVSALTIAVILGVSALLIAPVLDFKIEDVETHEIEEPKEIPYDPDYAPSGSVSKSWVAGEDPVPPLPEDTGGVIQEDGSKVWGTLP